MAENHKCHGCGAEVSTAQTYFFVKCKGQPVRYYCEKCAKERGYRGNTGKRN